MVKLLTWVGLAVVGYLIWKVYGGSSLLGGLTGSVGSAMQSPTGSQLY